jgi:hypothetical protein
MNKIKIYQQQTLIVLRDNSSIVLPFCSDNFCFFLEFEKKKFKKEIVEKDKKEETRTLFFSSNAT